VRILEEIHAWRHVVARPIGHVSDQPLLPRQPDDGGEERLGDAEGHVHRFGVAPLGHDPAVADDEAVGGRPDLVRADRRVERLCAQAGGVRERQVLRRGVLVGDGERHRGVERRDVDPGLSRRSPLPVEAVGIVAALRAGNRRPCHETHHAGDSLQHRRLLSAAVYARLAVGPGVLR
jgi:hypothetical protein